MRVLLSLALVLATTALATSASAQTWDRSSGAATSAEPTTPTGYGTWQTGTITVAAPEPAPVAVAVAPSERADHSVSMIVAGSIMLLTGYGAAAAWGGYYVDSLHLGPQGCNDTYAAWQFVPTIGPIVGVFAGGACVPGGLHVEEAVLPFVFSLVQIAGVVLLSAGVVLHEERSHAPRVAVSADANGGMARLTWSF